MAPAKLALFSTRRHSVPITGCTHGRRWPRETCAPARRTWSAPLRRYFSHIRGGDISVEDPEGDDLPDDAAALGLAHEVMQEIRDRPEIYSYADWTERVLVIVDETGRHVATLPFYVDAASARGEICPDRSQTCSNHGSQLP